MVGFLGQLMDPLVPPDRIVSMLLLQIAKLMEALSFIRICQILINCKVFIENNLMQMILNIILVITFLVLLIYCLVYTALFIISLAQFLFNLPNSEHERQVKINGIFSYFPQFILFSEYLDSPHKENAKLVVRRFILILILWSLFFILKFVIDNDFLMSLKK